MTTTEQLDKSIALREAGTGGEWKVGNLGQDVLPDVAFCDPPNAALIVDAVNNAHKYARELKEARAEIERLRSEVALKLDVAIDLAYNGTTRNYRIMANEVDGLRAQLAAIEAEVGHEPKETNDGEA